MTNDDMTYEPDDHICMYCGRYQEQPEDRPRDHISWDLAVTHQALENHRTKGGNAVHGLEDDIEDLLFELRTTFGDRQGGVL